MPAVELASASALRQTQWVKRAVTQETCDFRVIFLSSANSNREQTHITAPQKCGCAKQIHSTCKWIYLDISVCQ